MFRTLKSWLAARPLKSSTPPARARLGLESLEVRETPSGGVPYTTGGGPWQPGADQQPAANGVRYAVPGESIDQYALTSNGTLINNATNTIVANNVQEIGLYKSSTGTTLAALSGTTLCWSMSTSQYANVTNLNYADYNVRSAERTKLDGVAGFEIGSSGTLNELHNDGFFVHWSYNGNPNPTVMLGGVSKFQVAPDGTSYYTLQDRGGVYGDGSLDHWSGNTLTYGGQDHVDQFLVDRFNNVVSLHYNSTNLGLEQVRVNNTAVGWANYLFYYDSVGDSSWGNDPNRIVHY